MTIRKTKKKGNINQTVLSVNRTKQVFKEIVIKTTTESLLLMFGLQG